MLTEPPQGCEQVAARIGVAIRWLLKSWQNTPSITWEDRLVFVKVATEAITGKSNNVESAKALEALLASASEQDGGVLGVDDLLWQAKQPRYERTVHTGGERRTEDVSAFVDWAIELGRARNALVHGDDGTRLEYGRQAPHSTARLSRLRTASSARPSDSCSDSADFPPCGDEGCRVRASRR